MNTLHTLKLKNSFRYMNLLEPRAFARATNLRHLRARAFTRDIRDLIMLPGLRESLVSIEIANYFQKTKSALDVEDDELDRETCVLREAGPHLKKLHLLGYCGFKLEETHDVLSKLVIDTPQLEELAITVTKATLQFLIQHVVLPVLPNLKVLFVIGKDAIDTRDNDESFRRFARFENERDVPCQS